MAERRERSRVVEVGAEGVGLHYGGSYGAGARR
jgi:hypothetical protein